MLRSLIPALALLSLLCGEMSAQPSMKQNPEDTEHVRLDYVRPRIDLWQEGKLPNSKGLSLKDSVYNDRTWRIMTPRLYVYEVEKEKRTGTAVLVVPGGGYAKQAYEVAGDEFARWLNSYGITAFVLIHRLPNSPDLIEGSVAPTQDAQRAVRYIRAHAGEYGIDLDRVGVMGASSGGHVAACVCTVTSDWSASGDEYDAFSFIPDFGILVSPVISMDDPVANGGSRAVLLGDGWKDQTLRDRFSMEKHVTKANPPMFFVHAGDDTSVPPQNSLMMYEALLREGVRKSSIHIFPQGRHNIAIDNQLGSTAIWPQTAILWMRENGFLQRR